MEAVNTRKLQSMRWYRKKRMVTNICQYLIILVGFGLFLSSPLWLPKVVVFMGHFFFVLLPSAGRCILGPKCVFMIGNLIIVFLVGDSKLSSKPSQPILDVEHHQDHDHDDGDCVDGVDDDGDGDDEKDALPADELKRKVEDFIARVNSQRSLEARLIAGRAA